MPGVIAGDARDRLRQFLGRLALIAIEQARLRAIATADDLPLVSNQQATAVAIAEGHVVLEFDRASGHQAAIPPGELDRRQVAAGREAVAHDRGAREALVQDRALVPEIRETRGDISFHALWVPQLEGQEERVDDMATHVAQRTRAEVAPRAPLARVVGRVIRAHGRGSAPEVPVHAFGRRGLVGRTRGVRALRPDRTVRPRVRLAHLADEPGLEPLADLADALAGVTLVAHLGHDLVRARGLGQGAGLEDIMRDRLLDVDVLAAAHALHRDVGVGMVRRSDDDGVDVLALVEHDAEVGERVGLRELLDRPGAAPEVQVAQGDDVLVGAVAHVAAADAAEADGGDVQLRVRRDGRRRRVEPRAG